MRIIKGFLGSAVLGLVSLAVLYALMPYTGVEVSICRLSLMSAALLGVPGVTVLILLQLL